MDLGLRDTIALVTGASSGIGAATARLLAGRFAEPDEIARCVVFLASPAAGSVAGATLDANGGRELR